MIAKIEPKFPLGQVVATPAALEALSRTGQRADEFLNRHVVGDWGVLCDEDRQLNDEALIDDSRVLSSYVLMDGTKLWIITEADRSSTCVLLPSDY